MSLNKYLDVSPEVAEAFAAGKPVIWSKLHDQERFIPEIYGKDRAAGEGNDSLSSGQ